MLTVFLYLVIFPLFTFSQFLSYDAIRMRVPGRCMQGDYDCGLGQCVPISQFRDGKPDCMDGSDEWCFIGQVSCGPVYCADYKDALPCIVWPKCDGSTKQLPWCTASKEKLCADKKSFPCKGYGECVLWEWLLDGKKDCIDGSDEDENYVMPLEHAYRCARNQTGLYLPKPIPPPPEDHPSLYVEGCSFCPNNGKLPTGSVPTGDHTTPKYPFNISPSQENTQDPHSSAIPTDEPKNGDFFPSGVEISRVTHPQTPETQLPNEPIGDFFPTHSSTVPPTSLTTQSHTFRVITIPSIGRTQFPQAPLIFPMRPDLPPITAPSPLNNWPIPIVTSTPESHHQGSLPPITYPSGQEGPEKIPPIRPGIVISRPITSVAPSEYEMGGMPPGIDPFEVPDVSNTPPPEVTTVTPPLAGFRPITRPATGSYGSSEFEVPAEERYGNQKPGVDTLIPLIPGNVLPNFPTRRPLTIPSFFTLSSTPSYPSFPAPPQVTSKPGYIGMPTLIPDSEIGKYVQTMLPPSSASKLPNIVSVAPGNRQTTPPEGFIEETTRSPDNHGTRQTERPTENPLPETSTFQHAKTTSRSKIIHVGPNGIIETSGKVEEEPSTEDNLTGNPDETGSHVATGTDKIIHIGPTVPTTHSTPSSSYPSSSTEKNSISETTMPATSVGDPQIDSCIRKMLDGSSEQSPVCDCPNGQFKSTPGGNCEETLSLMNVKVHINSICNSDKLSLPEKQRILHKKIGTLYQSCIHSAAHGSSIVATVHCDDCSLSDVNRVITTRSFGEPGSLNVTTEGFGSELCADSDYNHCHVYSDCIVDREGLRYSCRCKKGTTDVSNGYGRQCDGFPEESDCIMVFGICLIVWLLFLLGAFMLSLLSCIACYTLCRQRCCRQIAIHPMNADGLQTVVIGSKAEKSLDPNRERLPHMKAIFAESLKHSAKGSTSVASAFALADFRRKKVSRPPDMSQVIEEINEHPTVPLPASESLPKISSLAKISTHTANSEPPTPVGVIETPILEKNSSSVSLVSANDNAPQLPSLPLPLPVPITTSASTTNLEEKGEKDKEGGAASQEQQVTETERPASSHSIGVQPTIWETYRVLGQQYSKSDLTERKPSVDSLEQMFEARLAETSRTTRTIPTVRTDKSDNSAIMFTAKPQKDDNEKPPAIVETNETAEGGEKVPEVTKDIVEEIQKNVEDAKESNLKKTDSKLADMIGVTSFHASREVSPSRPGSSDGKSNVEELLKETDSFSPSLEKSLEAALLIEMAKRGIELPLSPKTPIPTSDELEKVVAQKKIPDETDDSDVKPVKPKPESPRKVSESRKSSAKSIASSRKSKIPSVSQSRVSSAKQRHSEIGEQDNEPDMFVPLGARAIHENKKTLRRIGATGDLVPSTDESDPEIAFFKRLEKIRKETDRHTPFHPGRKYSRRRKPERTLSSISEKSAEIAAEAAIEYPVDTSISCPPTTRSFLEPRGPPIRRFVAKRKVIEATDETSDVDLPRLKPAKPVHPIISSPEIPDVTFQRSMENLHKSEVESKPETLVDSRLSSAKKSSFLKKKPTKAGTTEPSSSVQSSRHGSKIGSKATTPRNGEDTPLSHTSRSTRHSVISRKIAIRRHELKAVSGSAHDLSRTSPSRASATHTIRGAKSVGDLSKQRPNWDISPYRDTPGPSTFLPPITPSRNIRTAANSPQPRHRRSDSHFSMTSLPLIAHSPTSFWSSPHFNPSEDSRKPPKEDLWWNPNKRL